MGYGFILNPNLTLEQVKAMIEQKATRQRKMADDFIANVEKGLASLPPEAHSDFIGKMASISWMTLL